MRCRQRRGTYSPALVPRYNRRKPVRQRARPRQRDRGVFRPKFRPLPSIRRGLAFCFSRRRQKRLVLKSKKITPMNLFAKKPTTKEVLRESKREMSNATRGIEREITSLQLEEKKLVVEIKRTAKSGNEAAAKVLARQLVILRQQITKLQGSRAQLRGISTHTQAMHAQASLATGMKGAAKAMGTINQQMSPAKQMKVLQEFQKQTAQMDMTSEMMSETIDSVLDDDEAEEESEDLTNQVLDEIGVDVASQLSSAPKGKIRGKEVEDAESSLLDELEKSMASLKNH